MGHHEHGARSLRRARTGRVAEAHRRERHRILCGCGDALHCGASVGRFKKVGALHCNCRGSVAGRPKLGRGCCRGDEVRPSVTRRVLWRADLHRLRRGADPDGLPLRLVHRTDRKEGRAERWGW